MGDTGSTTDEKRTIAVVDDELLVGRAIRAGLRDRFEVRLFTDPRRFLEVVDQGEHFDMIFCDLMMPELTGMEVYEWLRVHKPEVVSRVVIATGGANSRRARRFLNTVDPPLLPKPFTRRQLRDCVAACLDEEHCRCR